MFSEVHFQVEDMTALMIQYFLDEQGEFRNPAALLQPSSFLSFILVIHSVELRALFYSTGLYMAIPIKMVDQLLSLPFSVILWLSSWCDQNTERSAHFHSPEFTRMCVEHCRASGTRMNMAFLAILCDIKPAAKWLRLLFENGDDLHAFLELSQTERTDHVYQFGNLIWNLNTDRAHINFNLFWNCLAGMTAFGLAAMVGNYAAIDSFLELASFKVFNAIMFS